MPDTFSDLPAGFTVASTPGVVSDIPAGFQIESLPKGYKLTTPQSAYPPLPLAPNRIPGELAGNPINPDPSAQMPTIGMYGVPLPGMRPQDWKEYPGVPDIAAGIQQIRQGLNEPTTAGPNGQPAVMGMYGVPLPAPAMNPSIAGGTSKIIGGAGKIAAPVAVASVMANPVTAIPLGLGMLVQKGATEALKQAGVRDEYANLGGDLAGLATPVAYGGVKLGLDYFDEAIQAHNDRADQLITEDNNTLLRTKEGLAHAQQLFSQPIPVTIDGDPARIELAGVGNSVQSAGRASFRVVDEASGRTLYSGWGDETQAWLRKNNAQSVDSPTPEEAPEHAPGALLSEQLYGKAEAPARLTSNELADLADFARKSQEEIDNLSDAEVDRFAAIARRAQLLDNAAAAHEDPLAGLDQDFAERQRQRYLRDGERRYEQAQAERANARLLTPEEMQAVADAMNGRWQPAESRQPGENPTSQPADLPPGFVVEHTPAEQKDGALAHAQAQPVVEHLQRNFLKDAPVPAGGTSALAAGIARAIGSYGDPQQTPAFLASGAEQEVWDIGNGNVLKVRPVEEDDSTMMRTLEQRLGNFANASVHREVIPYGDSFVSVEVAPKLRQAAAGEKDELALQQFGQQVHAKTGLWPDLGHENVGYDPDGNMKLLDLGDVTEGNPGAVEASRHAIEEIEEANGDRESARQRGLPTYQPGDPVSWLAKDGSTLSGYVRADEGGTKVRVTLQRDDPDSESFPLAKERLTKQGEVDDGRKPKGLPLSTQQAVDDLKAEWENAEKAAERAAERQVQVYTDKSPEAVEAARQNAIEHYFSFERDRVTRGVAELESFRELARSKGLDPEEYLREAGLPARWLKATGEALQSEQHDNGTGPARLLAASGEGRVSGTRAASERQGIPGESTTVVVPGEDTEIGARYEIWDLSRLTASHNGHTFLANPGYAHANERDYSKAENQQRIVNQSSEGKFNPRYLVTDNPDATNGPPVVDEDGHVLGGNSRVMTIQRVYGTNGGAADSYRRLLAKKAGQFGIDPESFAHLENPVLVRVASREALASLPGGSKWAIRKTNVAGTAALSSSERAAADAGQITPEIKAAIAQTIEEAGEGATLNDALAGRAGTALVNRLIAEGFFSEQERPALMDGRTGALTQLAKDRISKALLGEFFENSDQFARFPASLKQKLERVAAPLATVSDDPEWDLMPDVRQAINLIEYAQAHDIKNLDDVTAQRDIFGNESNWTPRAVTLARLLRDSKPNQVVSAIRRYVADREPTMFGEMTPEEAFADAFEAPESGMLADRAEESPAQRLAQKLAQNGWFSQLTRVIESKIPVRVPAKQALAILTNPQNGIKADELKWTDMADWLQKQTGTLTRDEILRHALENLVVVSEVHVNRPGHSSESRYARYVLKGKKQNYTELLFTIPDAKSPEFKAMMELRSKLNAKYGTERKYGLMGMMQWSADASVMDGRDPLTAEERAAWDRTLDAWMTESDQRATYRSPHWQTKNVVAHVRFDERADKAGRRILFVEEIQSDWHQAGREKGYRQGLAFPGNFASWAERRGMTPQEIETAWRGARGYGDDNPLYRQWEQELSEHRLDEARIPQAPFSKTWHEMVFRRMVRYAAENGFDSVAWTTGKQQARRYDLSQQVDGIRWEPVTSRTDGPGFLLVKHKGVRDYVRFQHSEMTASELPDYLGKEVAQNLLAQPMIAGGHELEGKNLQVGGRGMSGFYDSILPAFAAKFGKKWGASPKLIRLASPLPKPKEPEMLAASGDNQFEGERYNVVLFRGEEVAYANPWRLLAEQAFQSNPDVQVFLAGDEPLDRLREYGQPKPDPNGIAVYYAPNGRTVRVATGDQIVRRGWDAQAGTADAEARYKNDLTRIARNRAADARNFLAAHEKRMADYEKRAKGGRFLQTVHALDVTPEMSASVMQGQPLFARRLEGDPYRHGIAYSASTMVRNADWEVYPSSDRRPARMRLNWQAAQILGAAFGVNFNGITFEPGQAGTYSRILKLRAAVWQNAHINAINAAEGRRLSELADALAALDRLGKGAPVYLYRDRSTELAPAEADKPQPGTSAWTSVPTGTPQQAGDLMAQIRKSASTIREELTHVMQGTHAGGLRGSKHMPAREAAVLQAHPAWPEIAQALFARGYSRSSPGDQILEAGAKLIAGKLWQIPISPEQALSWLEQYYRALTALYGAKAARAVWRYADARFRIKPEWRQGDSTDAGDDRSENGEGYALDRTGPGRPDSADVSISRRGDRGSRPARAQDEGRERSLFDDGTEQQVNDSTAHDAATLEGDRLTAQLNSPLTRDEQRKKLKRSKAEPQTNLFEDTTPPQGSLFDRESDPVLGSGLGAMQPFVDRFLKQDVVPTAKQCAEIFKLAKIKDELLSLVAPAAREGAAPAALTVRANAAQLARATDQARAALTVAKKFFDAQPEAFNYAFIERIEAGKPQPTPDLQLIADTMRELLDSRRDAIQSLGTGKLQSFIHNYFPHVWKKSDRAKAVYENWGKRPLEGSKSFLKKRTVPTFTEGIQAGLEPVSKNPVELVLLKCREMDKYLAAHHILRAMKEQGQLRYVDAREGQAPFGWEKINDPAAVVYGSSIQNISEYPNEGLWNALERVQHALGLKHERGFEPLGQAIGRAYKGKDLIKTKHGTAEDVVAHEIGHQIDWLAGSSKKFVLEYPDKQTVERLQKARRTLKDTQGTTLDDRRAARQELESLQAAIQDRKQFAKELRDLADLRSGPQAYIRKREEKMAQLAEMWVGSRELFQRTAPHVFARWQEFLDENPKLHALRDIEGNTEVRRLSQPYDVGGLVIKGYWYAPEPAARILNNYLSPGLRDKSQIVRSFMSFANLMNQAQLGFSGFHAIFTTLEACTSQLALGIYQAAHGDVVKGVKSAALAPSAPFTTFMRGDRMLKEWYAPGTQGAFLAQLVDAAVAAGGRAHMDSFYRTHIGAKMMEAWRAGNVLGAMLRVPFALFEAPTQLIMEGLVPRLKMGAFADLAQYELERLGPNATIQEAQAALAKAWDSVDNRFGQLVYDNLFWHKYTKDIAMLLVRSPGWNVGDIRELGGAYPDTARLVKAKATGQGGPDDFTHRMAYLPAHLIVAATLGALLYYLWHGKAPHTLKDYFFPKDAHGKRWSPATYVKDEYNWAHNPAHTAANKLNPLVSLAIAVVSNKDYYGRKIINPQHHWPREMRELAEYVLKQFEPIWLQQMTDKHEPHGSLNDRLLPEVGITRAPKSLDQPNR